MRFTLFILALFASACSKPTTNPGPIGQPVNLRQYLPDSLRSGPTEADSTFRQQVHVGPDSANVEMEWATFRHTSGRYLNKISAKLVSAAPYDSLVLGTVSDLRNAGSKSQPVESGRIKVAWFRGRKSGEMSFDFDAAGAHLARQVAPTP